jgi:hypothetical protein
MLLNLSIIITELSVLEATIDNNLIKVRSIHQTIKDQLEFNQDRKSDIEELIKKRDKDIKQLLLEKNEEIKKLLSEKKEKDKEIKKLTKKDEEKDEENKKLQMRIVELETENKIYLQDREVVQKIAMQPKLSTTTNNDNRINNNFFDNPEKIKQMVNEKLTTEYICDGQKGVAQFAYDILLKDENGNMNYICSDPSRHIFKFYNSEGNIEKDVKAAKIINMLINAGITNKTLLIAPSLWTDDDGNINTNKFLTFSPYTNQISTLQIDNTTFRNELATLTSF